MRAGSSLVDTYTKVHTPTMWWSNLARIAPTQPFWVPLCSIWNCYLSSLSDYPNATNKEVLVKEIESVVGVSCKCNTLNTKEKKSN